ncbi:hypothetical protein J6590_074254 [Homalodisca vitripennis]|nr:hypothetical protein J6590_074254 [Homalodisca vitripennis]
MHLRNGVSLWEVDYGGKNNHNVPVQNKYQPEQRTDTAKTTKKADAIYIDNSITPYSTIYKSRRTSFREYSAANGEANDKSDRSLQTGYGLTDSEGSCSIMITGTNDVENGNDRASGCCRRFGEGPRDLTQLLLALILLPIRHYIRLSSRIQQPHHPGNLTCSPARTDSPGQTPLSSLVLPHETLQKL